ncbi:PepSY-like domain-containing protein [Sinomicrobium sp.]
MKLTKNVIGLLAVVMTLCYTSQLNAQEKVIPQSELPQTAQDFLKTNFKTQKVIQVVKDVDYLIKTDYEVLLDNAMKLEFDSDGNWKEIDGNHNALPEAVIPEKISAYIKQNFPTQTVEKIDKSSKKYEVELSNDLELDFTLTGDFIKIDD